MAIKALRRTTISSPKHIRRKKRIFWWQVTLTHVAVASLIFALYTAFHYEPLIISRVDIDGTNTLSSEEVRGVVQQALEGSYVLGIIPKLNTIFYPKDDLADQLVRTWPEIKDLYITRQGAQAISVLLKERQPVYVWCQIASREKATEQTATTTTATSPVTQAPDADTSCLYADESGYLYGIAPHMTSENVHLADIVRSDDSKIVILDETGLQKGIRDTALSRESLERLTAFITQASPLFKVPIKAIRLLPERQVDAYLSDNTRIAFTLDQDISVGVKNMSLFLQKQNGPFQYIDMRYSNKIYFKLSSDSKKQ